MRSPDSVRVQGTELEEIGAGVVETSGIGIGLDLGGLSGVVRARFRGIARGAGRRVWGEKLQVQQWFKGLVW